MIVCIPVLLHVQLSMHGVVYVLGRNNDNSALSCTQQ